MNYGDHMEERATTHDADDPECAKCGHPLSFHVRADMIAVQPCDYITNLEEESDTNSSWRSQLCGCQQFTAKQ